MSEDKAYYEDLRPFALSDEDRDAVMATQTECSFCWGTSLPAASASSRSRSSPSRKPKKPWCSVARRHSGCRIGNGFVVR